MIIWYSQIRYTEKIDANLKVQNFDSTIWRVHPPRGRFEGFRCAAMVWSAVDWRVASISLKAESGIFRRYCAVLFPPENLVCRLVLPQDTRAAPQGKNAQAVSRDYPCPCLPLPPTPQLLVCSCP